MILGYIFQTQKGKFFQVNLRAPMGGYLIQTKAALMYDREFIVKWNIKKRIV